VKYKKNSWLYYVNGEVMEYEPMHYRKRFIFKYPKKFLCFVIGEVEEELRGDEVELGEWNVLMDELWEVNRGCV
jgi:hypothetical protein